FRLEPVFLKTDVAQLVASDEARTAVGEVLFVADDGTVFIELEARRAELVVEQVVDPRNGRVVGLGRQAIECPAVNGCETERAVAYVRRHSLEGQSPVTAHTTNLAIGQVEGVDDFDNARGHETFARPPHPVTVRIVAIVFAATRRSRRAFDDHRARQTILIV